MIFIAVLQMLHCDLQDLPDFSPILIKENFFKSIMVTALFEVLCKRFCVNEKMLVLILCE